MQGLKIINLPVLGLTTATGLFPWAARLKRPTRGFPRRGLMISITSESETSAVLSWPALDRMGFSGGSSSSVVSPSPGYHHISKDMDKASLLLTVVSVEG